MPTLPVPDLCARREMLARRAARRTAAGQGTGALLAPLRRLTTAELLRAAAGAPAAAIDLAAALAAVCTAAGAAARRRPGWLAAELPSQPLPIAASVRLLQAGVLCVLHGALLQGGPAAVRCLPGPGTAVLVLRGGGRGGAAPALLRRLAAQAGGMALVCANAPFAAALRLPLCHDLPIKAAPQPEDLLEDRYSLLYQYLGALAAGPLP